MTVADVRHVVVGVEVTAALVVEEVLPPSTDNFQRVTVGEAQIAAAGEPPSPYAALGGFGPRGAGEKILDINDPPQPYVWPARTKLIGLKGDRTISGHGDISNPSTWWALYSGAFAQ